MTGGHGPTKPLTAEKILPESRDPDWSDRQ